ncbi:MAG: hypothetical protein IJ374_10105, partial [Lachnospiraceae bacterium]|nr:hypothetical protein [Lachnospiraceae bacterium]
LGITQLRGEMIKNTSLLKEQMEMDHARLDSRLAHVESDISQLKNDVRDINLTIEKEIRPQLELMCEMIIPEVRRFSRAADEIHAIKSDINVLNLTVAKHSELLNQRCAT